MAKGYKFARIVFGEKNNLKPLRGSMANLEKMLIDNDSNIMLYTVEGKLEDMMSASSAIDKKNLSHTEYEIKAALFNDGPGTKEEIGSEGVTFSRKLVVRRSISRAAHTPFQVLPLTLWMITIVVFFLGSTTRTSEKWSWTSTPDSGDE